MAQDEVRKVVAMGGSAGSLDVILHIAEELPEHAGCVYIVIVHRRHDTESILADLLSSRTRLKVKEVEDKEAIEPDTIYLAPSDYHLLVEDERTFTLDSSEKVNYSRPSIDVSFESIAEIFSNRCIGVLLSGANADGARGLQKIKEAGGITLVQDPCSAEVDYMPQQAINTFTVDYITTASEIGKKLQLLLSAGPP